MSPTMSSNISLFKQFHPQFFNTEVSDKKHHRIQTSKEQIKRFKDIDPTFHAPDIDTHQTPFEHPKYCNSILTSKRKNPSILNKHSTKHTEGNIKKEDTLNCKINKCSPTKVGGLCTRTQGIECLQYTKKNSVKMKTLRCSIRKKEGGPSVTSVDCQQINTMM